MRIRSSIPFVSILALTFLFAGPVLARENTDKPFHEDACSYDTAYPQPAHQTSRSASSGSCYYEIYDEADDGKWVKVKCKGITYERVECLRIADDGWYSCAWTGAFRGKTFDKAAKKVCGCE